jgi:bifunctional DNase/RNase
MTGPGDSVLDPANLPQPEDLIPPLEAPAPPEAAPEPAAAPESTPGLASPPPLGDFRMALVSSVTVDLPSQHPTVSLRETESPRRQLTFSIAMHDAVALSHALRRVPTARPLTHELLTGILQGFDIDVVAVRLVGRKGSVYFAELDLRGRTGRSVQACRPSDALTIALLQAVPAPILIDNRLFEQIGDVAPLGSV